MTNNENWKNKLINTTADIQLIRSSIPGWGNNTHLFTEEQWLAIQVSFVTKRPLLVKGDPGLGKTQIAPALASLLNAQFHKVVVNYDSRIDDLLYRVDHVNRLIEGQIDKSVPLDRFIKQGVVWNAISTDIPTENRSIEDPENLTGSVLLIDEIDKADSSLPNALLEVLDNKTISVPELEQTIEQNNDPLFVVITSNDERPMPDAFLRRCVVLDVRLSHLEDGIQQLMDIYQAKASDKDYFGKDTMEESDVRQIAKAIIEKRKEAKEARRYAPGTSEFLDCVKAVAELKLTAPEQLKKLLALLVEKDQMEGYE